MDKSKGKRPLEGNVDVLTNIILEESDAKEDELVSAFRRSKEEHEREHNRRGARTRDNASERNHPVMVSGVGALSIHLIARLTRPLH